MKGSRTLTDRDASIIKALVNFGMLNSDISSLMGCNQGRIAEINTGAKHGHVYAANLNDPAIRAYVTDLVLDHNLRVTTMLKKILK